jgi:hypothetical protein
MRDWLDENCGGWSVHDVERTERAIRGIVGKRLTYRNPNSPIAA